jgi:hypothetical protein
MADDVLLALPHPMPPVRNVRSTLMLGGLASLEAGGFMDAYAAAAPIEVRTAIQTSVAGMWIPLETALAHYMTCDRIGISSDSAAKLGRSTFARTKGLLLGTAIGIAKTAGVTPWSLMPYLQRFWQRGIDGGGVQALRLGPKEAQLDLIACPLFRSHYFRGALRGLTTNLFELVCRKAYFHERRVDDPNMAISFRVQWV